ncbi:transposase [Laribacter hongkongensis]|nr:transposase [Laribacter hongkongensis]
MSTQRFTPEFKEEAVKQVTERGYSVAEVSARLGVSSHSLYKWVKAVSPDNLDFLQPSKPTDNSFIKSFQGSLRDEYLNAHG